MMEGLTRIHRLCGGDRSPKPVIHVDCITHRNDPILRGTMRAACLAAIPKRDDQFDFRSSTA